MDDPRKSGRFTISDIRAHLERERQWKAVRLVAVIVGMVALVAAMVCLAVWG